MIGRRWACIAGLIMALACRSTAGDLTGPSAAPPVAVAKVTIQDFAFTPATGSLVVGGAVRWTNYGPSPHTATSDAGFWDSGQLRPPGPGASVGGSFETIFPQPGIYHYYCVIHPPPLYPTFIGTIVVNP